MTVQTVTQYVWQCVRSEWAYHPKWPMTSHCYPEAPHPDDHGCRWVLEAIPAPAGGRETDTGAPVPPCRAPGVTSSDLVTFVNAVTRIVNEGERS